MISLLIRKEHHVIAPVCHPGARALDEVGHQFVIGIMEMYPVTLGKGGQLILAVAASSIDLATHHAGTIAFRNAGCIIGRAIVVHPNFIEMLRLPQRGVQQAGEIGSSIIRRNQHGYRWPDTH